MELDRDPFYGIESVTNIIVDQHINLVESSLKFLSCCCADLLNTYDIVPIAGGVSTTKFEAVEESSFCSRCLCNPHHALTLHVQTQNTNVLEIDKPFRCCCCAIGYCQKEITVRRLFPQRHVIGYVRQPFCGGCIEPQLNIYVPDPNGKRLGTVRGPWCCIGGCGGSQFDIKGENDVFLAQIKRGGLTELGLIRGIMTDSDKYHIDFTSSHLSGDEKLVLLATVMFIDYLYFEGQTAFICELLKCPPTCWCKCCELYCCGCTIPIKCMCGVPMRSSTVRPGVLPGQGPVPTGVGYTPFSGPAALGAMGAAAVAADPGPPVTTTEPQEPPHQEQRPPEYHSAGQIMPTGDMSVLAQPPGGPLVTPFESRVTPEVETKQPY